MQKRILIVGEDPEFRRDLLGGQGQNDGRFAFECARTGLEALVRLDQPYTAVVADWRLPGTITGSGLLDEVMSRQPAALRFVRAHLDDQAAVLRSVGTGHRFLIKPTDLSTLVYAVESGLALETWLPMENVRKHLGQLKNIPSPPQLYFQIVKQLESPEASLDEIGDSIAQDPAITAKLLQLVNSAVFGLHLRVGHPAEAIGYIGLEATKSLVLLAHTFSHFSTLTSPAFSIERLWHHSFSTARTARWIAESEISGRELASETFTAGLLHDFGKLVLAANLPAEFQCAVERATAEEVELWQAELDTLGTHHGEVGACLLAIWGLPVPIIEAVGLHHRPACLSAREFTPLAAVHVANVFAQSTDLNRPRPALPQLDMDFLRTAGCEERVADWTRVISEMADHAHSAR